MIPRAIDMIFSVSNQLKDRGWKYVMEGQFLEVYNEVVGSHGPLHRRHTHTRTRSTICWEAVNSIPRSTRSSSTKRVE
jgi:hypothetical protein